MKRVNVIKNEDSPVDDSESTEPVIDVSKLSSGRRSDGPVKTSTQRMEMK